jgi:mono/diheme cytochrome c family protein
MPAWWHLSAADVGALIAFVRSWQKGGALVRDEPPPPGDYAAGRVHYDMACASCHGEQAIGGVGPQLANEVLLSSASDAQLFAWIAHGRTGTAMKGFLAEEQGPAELSPTQIADVIAYLRYVGSSGDLPVLRTGTGNASLGPVLYGGNCASCHGDDGEGASGPQLDNEAFLRTASDGFLAATIVLGRPGTAMQPMVHGREGLGQISPDHVADVIAFMRRWDVDDPWRLRRRVAEVSDRAVSSGRYQYAAYCAGCHGPTGLGARDGDGYYAPAINNEEFLTAASDGFLLATIARGRSETPMRPFGAGGGGIVSLHGDDISDIVAFLRSWQTNQYPIAGGKQ